MWPPTSTRVNGKYPSEVERGVLNSLALQLPAARYVVDDASGDVKISVGIHAWRSRLNRWRHVLGLPRITRWSQPSTDVSLMWEYAQQKRG